ncbi:hypothetical protein BXY64_3604 [Marinifilum flexuosum]|uniref:Uncharacterized protein n=1 Tax=Marinifilum flexuosum TaxID=1117708 RepID=A0A419WTE2_9BACT|nr:hypothetical protein BXY64_3604 [Marinifilum flexuosum]
MQIASSELEVLVFQLSKRGSKLSKCNSDVDKFQNLFIKLK